jgi:hypothetical protein
MDNSSDSLLAVVRPHLLEAILVPLYSIWIGTESFCSMSFTQTFYDKVSLELLRAGVQERHASMLSSPEKLALGKISVVNGPRFGCNSQARTPQLERLGWTGWLLAEG